MSEPRSAWRSHVLDGALLWFHPATGTNVRIDGPRTRALERRAPRTVMFGITNRCNLDCHFCSRDREMTSEWTVESAFEMLSGLSTHGVLEVAFGGGEPLAFRGFDQLVEKLATETELALHITTNGTLLTGPRLARLRPYLGDIRLSLYDDQPWRERVGLLADEGSFGVNLIATPASLTKLAAQLRELAELGCRDVALLSYVGADRSMQLSASDDARLAELIAQSPVPARISVCFGARLHPLPTLDTGRRSDCGAGRDFIVLTADQRLQACSFHHAGPRVTTADEVIAAWTTNRATLASASSREGCARPASPGSELCDGIRIWRGFSGNNSGDCVLVGRFDELEDAERYVAELTPGFSRGNQYSQDWLRLLAEAGITAEQSETSPESIVRSGATVMLHTDSAVGDDFPSLRTLLWRRGGRAVFNGIHVHENTPLVAGLRFPDVASLEAAELELLVENRHDFVRRGLDLFGTIDDLELSEGIAKVERLAALHGGRAAGELVAIDGSIDWPRVLSVTADETRHWLYSEGDEPVVADRISPRLGFIIQQRGGVAHTFTGRRLRLVMTFWRKGDGLLLPSAQALAAELRSMLGPDVVIAHTEGHARQVCIDTEKPAAAVRAARGLAAAQQLECWVSPQSVDPLAHALARISRDLGRRRT